MFTRFVIMGVPNMTLMQPPVRGRFRHQVTSPFGTLKSLPPRFLVLPLSGVINYPR